MDMDYQNLGNDFEFFYIDSYKKLKLWFSMENIAWYVLYIYSFNFEEN